MVIMHIYNRNQELMHFNKISTEMKHKEDSLFSALGQRNGSHPEKSREVLCKFLQRT